jgi:hypothetical protein
MQILCIKKLERLEAGVEDSGNALSDLLPRRAPSQ